MFSPQTLGALYPKVAPQDFIHLPSRLLLRTYYRSAPGTSKSPAGTEPTFPSLGLQMEGATEERSGWGMTQCPGVILGVRETGAQRPYSTWSGPAQPISHGTSPARVIQKGLALGGGWGRLGIGGPPVRCPQHPSQKGPGPFWKPRISCCCAER